MSATSGAKRQSWTRLAVALHWLVAVLILFNIGLGLVAEEMAMSPAKLQVFLWHKSVGLTVLALAGLRLCWRFAHAPPPPANDQSDAEQRIASIVHWSLYALIFLVPLTGWWLNSVANFPFRWFGLFAVPHIASPSEAQEGWAELTHVWLAWGLSGLVAAHAAAAFKHHLINRDDVLRRMWPQRRGQLALLLLVVGLPLLVWSQIGGPGRTSNATAEVAALGVEQTQLSGQADAWQMVREQSRLGFVASYDEVPVEGVFRRFDADLRFDPEDLAGSGFDVEIAIASLDTASSDRDDIIRGDTWFFVDQFPKARFVTRSIQALGAQRYVADASLRIRNQQQDVPFEFEWQEQDDGRAHLTAQVELDRRNFDVGTDSWATDNTVGFAVTVEVELVLTRP